MSVSSHVEPGLDISRYHTYSWSAPDALPVPDPRLSENPFYKDHIEGAVEKQLATRGFSMASASPDLLVHYHAVIDRRIDVSRINREGLDCVGPDCPPEVFEYEAGTLVIDVVDAKTNRVIWRGWAQDTVEGVLNNEDRLARQIEQGVTRMFARFPRAAQGEKR